MRFIILIIAASLVSGCFIFPSGSKFVAEQLPVNGDSLVYVFREGDVARAVPSYGVLINGKKYSALDYHQYDTFILSPGVYTFSTSGMTDGDAVIAEKITIEAGKTYYIKQYQHKDGGGCVVIGFSSNCNIRVVHTYTVESSAEIPPKLYGFRKASPIK